jgi:hypothetical protein
LGKGERIAETIDSPWAAPPPANSYRKSWDFALKA